MEHTIGFLQMGDGQLAGSLGPKFLKNFEVPNNISIRIVGKEKKETFTNVFHNAYSGGPGDPYGELPEYYDKAVLNSFENSPSEFKRIYALAEIKGEPAGAGMLFFNREIAGIYSLGTKREHRREGVGTSLSKFLVEMAMENNINKIMLQTEKDSSVEEWYKNLGFKRTFLANYFVEN